MKPRRGETYQAFGMSSVRLLERRDQAGQCEYRQHVFRRRNSSLCDEEHCLFLNALQVRISHIADFFISDRSCNVYPRRPVEIAFGYLQVKLVIDQGLVVLIACSKHGGFSFEIKSRYEG